MKWLILGILLGGCATTAPLPARAVELNRSGAEALAAGDLTTAEARVQVALEYNPRFTEAWVNLGLIELKRGNFDAARKHLKRARDLNPDLPAPHHALGLVADEQGAHLEAEKHYREALKVDPGFLPARANLARRLFERGQNDEARQQFLRLVEIDDTSREGWAGYVEALLRLEREAEADAALDRAHQRLGGDPAILLLVARKLLRHDKIAEAEGILLPITRDPDRLRACAAWAWLAIAAVARGDAEAAVAAASRAQEIERSDGLAAFAMAQARALRTRLFGVAPTPPSR
jgi:type IV pilus assembly protein PilF